MGQEHGGYLMRSLVATPGVIGVACTNSVVLCTLGFTDTLNRVAQVYSAVAIDFRCIEAVETKIDRFSTGIR